MDLQQQVQEMFGDEPMEPTQDEMSQLIIFINETIQIIKLDHTSQFVDKLKALLTWMGKCFPNDESVSITLTLLDSFLKSLGPDVLLQEWYKEMKPFFSDCSQQSLQLSDFESKLNILKQLQFTNKMNLIEQRSDAKDVKMMVWKYIHRLNILAIEFHRWENDSIIYRVVNAFTTNVNANQTNMQKLFSSVYQLTRTIDHLLVLAQYLEKNQSLVHQMGMIDNISTHLQKMLQSYYQTIGNIPNSDAPGKVHYDYDSEEDVEEPDQQVVQKATHLKKKKY